ncbi:MAG TPA: hypothetical protein PLE19_03255 [Planctomycetota bacterium]|nr:hypothetical protein [Planctomycetota bacterium]HRR79632.1 hypothetical protein [Planctomycetota bacterium]HRT95111.1 hypothetical protein [Planctomycetota bacterium]
MTGQLTIGDKLLAAALALEQSGKNHFSAEDLVVMAWHRFPHAFGLSGHMDQHGTPMYPDSNRVYMEIMGSKPLRKQGLLRKVGSKLYALTDAGRQRAAMVSETPQETLPEKWSLAREKIDQIRRLFDSRAAAKLREGQPEELSFFDACGFWGINPRSRAKDLWSRFAHIEALLDAAIESLGDRDRAASRHGSSSYGVEDIRTLRRTHDFLCDRYSREIAVIKARTDER